jgi:hypothetical protein
LYLKTMLPIVVGSNALFWIAGVVSVAAIAFLKPIGGQIRWWIVALSLFALASTAIGAGFIPHYFVPVLPWLSLGVAVVAHHFTPQRSALTTGIQMAILASLVLFNASYFLRPNHLKIMEQNYHWNGFSELKAIGKELKKRMKPGETLAVLGSEPQLYLYSGATACLPHLYTYPVVRDNPFQAQFQREYIESFDQCRPTYCVVTSSEASWMPNFAQQPFFKNEIMSRIQQRYQLIGRANMGQVPLNIVWDEGLKNHKAPQVPPVLIFRLK